MEAAMHFGFRPPEPVNLDSIDICVGETTADCFCSRCTAHEYMHASCYLTTPIGAAISRPCWQNRSGRGLYRRGYNVYRYNIKRAADKLYWERMRLAYIGWLNYSPAAMVLASRWQAGHYDKVASMARDMQECGF